ncbi:MAG: radical SAM family heme chaperone HemW [Bacilli bacterium]|nr:radical SAM family heme chaperone HemW [Bacilli bacterium]
MHVKSAYIHIPFCSNICSYCDFAKVIYNKKLVSKYLDTLEKEIKSNYKNEVLDTLYIGGGTPSALNISELERLFKIIKIFKLNSNIEFTIECNVNDITEEKMTLFKKNNVNRISLGVQTFNENTLIEMRREHSYELVKEKIEFIKNVGISNISVDLIYAYPKTTLETLNTDLEKILSLDINHISTYSLIIEPHTILHINKAKNVPEELDYEMYKLICSKLKINGFNHYEISNFAKDGYESKHNLTYWNNEEYYGFGLAASGYLNNTRYTNTRSFDSYFNHNYVYEEEKLTEKDKIIYELILGLRKINGISIDDVNQKYNINLLDNKLIKDLVLKNKLEIRNNHIKVPYDKIYVENEILMELLDYE